MDILVEKLKKLGFNSYESKVYIALLKKSPATGYEVAKISDVPQARAYDALKSLENEGVVFSTKEKPQRYTPIPPKELIKRFKRQINSTIDFLEKKLPDLKNDYNEPIHNIVGYDKNIEKLKEVIKNTNKSIYVEIWAADFKQLENELNEAYDRGVDIKIVAYDNFNTMIGLVYQHEGAKEVEYNVGSRLIYLLSDNMESILGKIEDRLIWTKNVDIAYLMREYIAHEMFLLDINGKFPEQLKYFYGPELIRLKDKILTKKCSYNIH